MKWNRFPSFLVSNNSCPLSSVHLIISKSAELSSDTRCTTSPNWILERNSPSFVSVVGAFYANFEHLMIGERSKAPYMKLFHNRFNFILTIFDNFQTAHIRWRNGICLHFNKPAILIGKIIGKFWICEHVFVYLKNFPANWRASDTKITNAFYGSVCSFLFLHQFLLVST